MTRRSGATAATCRSPIRSRSASTCSDRPPTRTRATANCSASDSWTQVMLGQRITPKTYHPAARLLSAGGAHQVPRRIPRVDPAGGCAHAGAPGVRESILQGQQQRLELKAALTFAAASGFSTAKAQVRSRTGAARRHRQSGRRSRRAGRAGSGQDVRRRDQLLPRRAGEGSAHVPAIRDRAAARGLRRIFRSQMPAGCDSPPAISRWSQRRRRTSSTCSAFRTSIRCSRNQLAFIHYLFKANLGGTSFYRHRKTGFESIDQERKPEYMRQVELEAHGPDTPPAEYINGTRRSTNRVATRKGSTTACCCTAAIRSTRGRWRENFIPDPNPRTGRLSINGFLA